MLILKLLSIYDKRKQFNVNSAYFEAVGSEIEKDYYVSPLTKAFQQ